MADSKEPTKAEAKTDPKDPKVADPQPVEPKTSGKLSKAGESGDPVVQHALAELQTARSNRDGLDVDRASVKAADDAVKAAEKRLADLGYE